ncbi:hypothetical protein DXB25_09225 [Lachnospiraceae bacterium OM02-31]|nr:hypothetical protein [Lachnospiraceae bacterium]RJW50536.1 hypothetical protein DXB25_09225 [Lachnospiraceae bacterium OM02-31]
MPSGNIRVMPGREGEPGEGQAAYRADVEMIRAPPTYFFDCYAQKAVLISHFVVHFYHTK